MASEAQKLKLGFLCLLLFLGPSSQSQLDTLVQGQQLKNGDELVSAQGIFKLGFFGLSDNKFYLGIWYNNDLALLQENLVWVANRDTPIFDKSASLTIVNYGNLKISFNGSLSMALYSGQEASNTSAVLLDTGNFVLSVTSSGRQLWQSFDYPSHTLLPGMKLGVNRKTGHEWFLTSWIGNEVPDSGNFKVCLHPNHTNQLVILWYDNIYWTSGSWNNGNFNSSPSRPIDSYRSFNYISNENETYFNYSGKEVVATFRWLKIGYLGTLSNGSGPLVNCTSDSSSLHEGCVAKELRCRSPYDTFSPLSVVWNNENRFEFNEGDNLTLRDCEAKCFNNCSCIAYASKNQDARTGCQIWSAGENPMIGANIQRTIYFLDGQALPYLDRRNLIKNGFLWAFIPILAMALVGFIISAYYLGYKKAIKFIAKGKQVMKQKKLLQELGVGFSKVKTQANTRQASHDLQIFSFESLSIATRNFSAKYKLGEGGFGSVYKGTLSDGQEIAIKRLSKGSRQGLVEFKNETTLIAKLQHTNLVKLLGICIEEEEKILIYEYMPNKSLDFFLFDSTKKSSLNWKKRLNIIEGIAQGLVYLHKYSRLTIIHRDLKAGNILLDEEMNPKISDFGLARIFELKGSEENTNRIVGTYGYMSPEYALNGVVSRKIDVFSYGVLLLEIISSKKNNSLHLDNQLNLIGYAWKLWNEGNSLELLDPTILDESLCQSEVLRCIHVGLLCVQDQAKDRPTILDVVSMLSNETIHLFPPKQPAYFVNTIQEESSEVCEIKPKNCSINNVTVSVMEAR